jgi:hypothetical protein
MIPSKLTKEEKEEEKARDKINREKKPKKEKDITKIVKKKDYKDGISKAVIKLSKKENKKDIVDKLDKKGIKVLHWKNEIIDENNEINYVGMYSGNGLTNQENLLILDEMTSEIIKKQKKDKSTETYLNSMIIMGIDKDIKELQLGGAR